MTEHDMSKRASLLDAHLRLLWSKSNARHHILHQIQMQERDFRIFFSRKQHNGYVKISKKQKGKSNKRKRK